MVKKIKKIVACEHGRKGGLGTAQFGMVLCRCCRHEFPPWPPQTPLGDFCKECRPALLRIDLACGQNKTKDYTGVDIAAVDGVDVVHDLRERPWPFKDESAEDLVANHFFEHLTGRERIAFMEECYRILVPGGHLKIVVPYWANARAIQDPTHAWPPVCEASFLYFNQAWLKENKLDHYGIRCDFDFGYAYNIKAAWGGRNDESKMFAVMHYVNVADDLVVTLTKRAVGT